MVKNNNEIDATKAYVKEENRKHDEFVNYVAEDVFKSLSQEDKDYIFKHPSSIDHHFGMGLGIRNKYIHGQNLEFDVGHPDSLSSEITSKIASLIIDNYDYENPFYRHMYDDFTFDHVRRLYFALMGEYPDRILDEYADKPDDYAAAKECKQVIRDIVLNAERFKDNCKAYGITEAQYQVYVKFADEYNAHNWDVVPYDVALLGSKKLPKEERDRWLELMRAVLEQAPRMSITMPAFVFNQRDAVLLAVSVFGKALKRFPRFNKDDDIICMALMDNGEAIQYVHKDMRADPKYLRLALSSEYGDTLKMRCLEKYRDQDEWVKIALEANGKNIKYASPRIRDDFEMAKFAVLHQKDFYPESTVCNLSKRLRDNIEIALIDIRDGHACVDDYSKRLRDSEKVAEALLDSEQSWKLYLMSERIQKKFSV